jgi:hypothetical protein
MSKQSKDVVGRINTLVESWRTQEPNRSFYGHSLPQFQVAVQPVFAVREEGAELAKRTVANSAKRRDVDGDAQALIRNIVHAIKADPQVGEDSLLYAAMGYVRKADNRAGRKRPRARVVVPPPEGDAKVVEEKV